MKSRCWRSLPEGSGFRLTARLALYLLRRGYANAYSVRFTKQGVGSFFDTSSLFSLILGYLLSSHLAPIHKD